jgi:ribosomal protein S18 acetylase RimI-like enzyme
MVQENIHTNRTIQTQLRYRFAGQQDLLALYDLYMEPSCNPFLTYDQMDVPSFEKIFADLLISNTLYVSEMEGQVVGSFRLIPKTYRQACTVYIGGFVVNPLLKGRGIGSAMMEYIKSDAAKNGYKRIELTVDLKNKAAIALYVKSGFEFEGRLRMSYQYNNEGPYYDEYLMGLIL